MKDILKRWYSGDLLPYEEIKTEDESYRAIYRRLHTNFQQLRSSLSEEQQKTLQDLTADMYALADADGYAHFAYGFRLGTTLLCETLYQ